MINLFNKIFLFNASVAEQIAIKGEEKEEKKRYKNILKAIKREAKCGGRSITTRWLSDFQLENLRKLGFSLQETENNIWEVRW